MKLIVNRTLYLAWLSIKGLGYYHNNDDNNNNNNNNNNLCTILSMNDSEKTGMGHKKVSRRLLKNCRKNTLLILLLFARRRDTIEIDEK